MRQLSYTLKFTSNWLAGNGRSLF